MIVEHFIGFTYLHGLGAESITQYIINKIAKMTLSINAFDGASATGGHISGVQARLKQYNEKILYVHCF